RPHFLVFDIIQVRSNGILRLHVRRRNRCSRRLVSIFRDRFSRQQDRLIIRWELRRLFFSVPSAFRPASAFRPIASSSTKSSAAIATVTTIASRLPLRAFFRRRFRGTVLGFRTTVLVPRNRLAR